MLYLRRSSFYYFHFFVELVTECPRSVAGHVFNKTLVCFDTEMISISAKIGLYIYLNVLILLWIINNAEDSS